MAWLVTVLTLAVSLAGVSLVWADLPGPVVQPTDASDRWALHPSPMPAVETIVGMGVDSRPVYGLYGWRGEYRRYRDSIREVGYRSYRMSGVLGDKTMAMVVADDMEVMMTLTYRLPDGRKNRTHFESDEAFIAGYIRYVEDFLSRYGPEGTFFSDSPELPHRPIAHVEILNEPNFQYMIPPRKGEPRAKLEAEREALYARLLPAVYESVKARWPSVTVVGFGAGGAGRGDVRFIANVHGLNPDLGASYDVLSTHPYSKPVPFEAFHFKRWGGYASIESLSQIRQAMAGSGGADRPIWYTELGWPISHADGGRFAPPRAKGPFVSTLMQAAYIVRSYALAVRLGVGRVHTMHATDTDRFNGGVFTHDTGTWRPAAFATQTMIRLVPHPKLLGSIHDGDGGLYAYRFDPDATDKDATPVLMAWNVTGPMTVELPVAARARATAVDMLGHRTPLEVSGGEASVAIGPCPVYVTTTDEGN